MKIGMKIKILASICTKIKKSNDEVVVSDIEGLRTRLNETSI